MVVGADHDNAAVPVDAVTVTVVPCTVVPPAPLQASVNFVVTVSTGVVAVPEVPSVPLQPPEALQDAAFVDDHERAEVAPLFTVLGLAAKVTVGAGLVTVTVATCEALPPAPVQVRL